MKLLPLFYILVSLVFYHVNSTESIESTIDVSLKCDLERQKHFSLFAQTIIFTAIQTPWQ